MTTDLCEVANDAVLIARTVLIREVLHGVAELPARGTSRETSSQGCDARLFDVGALPMACPGGERLISATEASYGFPI